MNEIFRKVAAAAARAVGSPWTFLFSVLLIIAWAATGPIFGFNDTWQLVINTSTTIITFLMVFLIQNTQNRDAKGIHLKLDELIKANKRARNQMIDLDSLSDEQLKSLEEEYKRICRSEDSPRGEHAALQADRVRDELEDRAEEHETTATR